MKRNKWKRTLAFVTGIFCSLQINTISVQAADYWPEGPAVESEAAIVLEITSGTVLYEKNSQDTHYPASITKIMTTLVALENSDLNEVVTFSDAAIDNTEGSGIARD
ncbi:MAG: D-alanyl-D-alanine carboxypeptidase, partial [Lachnospiraceae bacterium]|nr:D-alanyl-D-alanine carboxypeptidase [Lachnospiraceae bacterium]